MKRTTTNEELIQMNVEWCQTELDYELYQLNGEMKLRYIAEIINQILENAHKMSYQHKLYLMGETVKQCNGNSVIGDVVSEQQKENLK